MDLRHGVEYEDYRLEVREFLTANWPPAGGADRLPSKDQIVEFRDLATGRGYLRRGTPATTSTAHPLPRTGAST